MSEVNILTDDKVCPFKVIISQELSDHSYAEIYDWTDDSESDLYVNRCLDSELSASTDDAYTLRYNGDYSGMLVPSERSDHLLNKRTSEYYLHRENSMLINKHRIQLRCSHIIIKHMHSETPSSWRKQKIEITRKEALKKIMKIRSLLINGKVSFEKIARVSSDCCSARRNGDLGTFHPGQIWPDFERIITGLRINELSQIFETRAGFHIVLRTQPENQRETRRFKIFSTNEKIKAQKHMKKGQTGFKSKLTIKRSRQCQNFGELYRQEMDHKEDDFDRKACEISTNKAFLTIEEENDFKLKLYDEQERQIRETIVDHTPTEDINKLIIKDSSNDKFVENVPLEVKISGLNGSKKEEEKPFILRHAKNATDLLRCCDSLVDAKTHVLIPRQFLVGPIESSTCVTVSGSGRFPCEWDLKEHQYDKWKPPNCERETECIWKRKSLLTLTSASSDE